jgi:limonene 1,2-monooxygenase
LPYHNPLMVADRIIQLDHHTRGRVMFGAGPGLLASDALMLGIDPMTQRDRMAEGIDVILRLFRDETVTEKTDWYTLVNARLHPAALHQTLSGNGGGQRRHALRRAARREI